MRYPRPVPLIGDASSAHERATAPGAWAFPTAQRDAAYQVMDARRDIRRFRPDPVDDEILRRVLAAGHTAPSVGHSQPWRFLLARDPELRDRAALLAEEQKLAQAAHMEPESARRLLDLKLDGIRDAPLGVVMCCDRRTPAAGVLGRATYPDTDLWSCAAAVQNIWLAARAEGLGVGWVTLFRPEDLAHLTGLPDGVATLGWLCLGWPDERPPEPGLQRRGWSRRMPLDDVILTDRWPAEDDEEDATPTPEPPPSHLKSPDQSAVVAARDAADELLTAPESLGVLDRSVDRVLAVRTSPAPQEGGTRPAGRLLLAGSDHPVAHHQVSAFPTRVTRDVLTAAVAGHSVGTTAAHAAGLDTVVVDAGADGEPVPGAEPARPHEPRGDLASTDALSPADCDHLIDRGHALGAAAVRETDGLVVLGEVGVANTTPAAALAAALLGENPTRTAGLGAGADSAMLRRKRDVIDAAVERLAAHPNPNDPRAVLGAVGGPEFAVLTGAVLGAAEAGGVLLLDGLATSVAALAAIRLEPGAAAHLLAGQRSREEAHQLVLAALGLEPLLDLRLRAGEGAGGCLAAGLLRDALRIRQEAARVTTS